MRRLLISIMLTLAPTLALASPPAPQAQTPAAVDFKGFVSLSETVMNIRQDRLVSKTEFLKMANEPDTIMLDTRSKQAFDLGHINGAVHLNFSDFTEDKLNKVIGSKDRRILIYCNNNFTDNVKPFVLKRLELALNVPTFINLHGYGYENVYELKDAVSIHDPLMQIVSTPQKL